MIRRIMILLSLGIFIFLKNFYELFVLNCNSEINVKNVFIFFNVMFDFCIEIS